MKKILSLISVLSLVLIFLLTGCKPNGMPDYTYKIGTKVLEVTDKYLDLEISADEAKEEINELSDRLYEYSETTNDTHTLYVKISINKIESGFMIYGDETDIIDGRNSLAEDLGKPKRDYY